MDSWNQRNFERLSRLAETLEVSEELKELAAFCRLRERGLRRPAFEALERFLATSRTWSAKRARTVCKRILESHARAPAHQFLNQPLLSRFVFPVLADWISEEPSSPDATRWLGLLRRDEDLLVRALDHSPTDVAVRRELVNRELGIVEHATHHLSESILLGSLGETRAALSKAQALLGTAPEPSAFSDLLTEASQFERMLDDWEAFSESSASSFPEWCRRHGRQYSWPTIVYYQPRR